MLLAKTFVREGLLVLCLMIATAFPVMAQSGVGGIGGTVMDTTGAVLPGATVTLTSAQGTIGGNQETISDGRGAYQFVRLVPGTYSVRAQVRIVVDTLMTGELGAL